MVAKNHSGQNIKIFRKRRGISAETLAERVGLSPATIYRYENGDISNMGADKLKDLADALGVTAGELMGWADDEPASPSAHAVSCTPEELELLQIFRSLSQSWQETALNMMRGFAGNPKTQEGPPATRMA